MIIDRAIKNVVCENIRNREWPKISRAEIEVSVSELLLVGKNRFELSKEYFDKTILKEIPCVAATFSRYSHYGSENEIMIHLISNQIGNILCKEPVQISLEYHNGDLFLPFKDMLELKLLKGSKSQKKIMEVKNELEKMENLLFEKHKDLFLDAASFGIDNNFNKEPRLSTVSQEFKVGLDNECLILSLSSDIINYLHKSMYLSYYYNPLFNFNNKNYISTKFGIFNLQTNIFGMERLLTKSWQDGETDRVVRLFNNLKVDYAQLPNYLQLEVEKVKSLRK